MAPTKAKSNPEAGVRLAINTLTRRLYFFNGERLVNEYSVAVGKPATPTPTGNYKVKNKILNPGGALGTRWMGLTIPGGTYGIHGNNNPSSIGQSVSLGCIRMFNNQVEELFPKIAIGTPVHIYNNYTTAAPGMETENNGNAKASGGSLNGQRYTILPGDTIWKIAQRFRVSQEEIIAVNALSDPNRISAGQTIIIPDQ